MDGAALVQQRFDERGFAATGVADQCDGTDGFGLVFHVLPSSCNRYRALLVKKARPAS
jgi:hypothetical protein